MRLSARLRENWMDPAAAWHEPSGYARTPGGLVPYRTRGVGEPVILVPGLAGGQALLEPLARRLARTCQVYQFDLAGDRSPLRRRTDGLFAAEVQDLGELVQALGLERPTLFGCSYGAALALELAVQRPALLGGLIVTGAGERFQPRLGGRVARWALERYDLPPDSPFLNQFFNLLHGGIPGDAALARHVVQRCWETDQGVMAARLRGLDGFDVGDRLWRVDCPALVLAGTKDVVVPADQQRALADQIASARFVALAGAGHVGFLSEAREVSREVVRMLRDRQRAML